MRLKQYIKLLDTMLNVLNRMDEHNWKHRQIVLLEHLNQLKQNIEDNLHCAVCDTNQAHWYKLVCLDCWTKKVYGNQQWIKEVLQKIQQVEQDTCYQQLADIEEMLIELNKWNGDK